MAKQELYYKNTNSNTYKDIFMSEAVAVNPNVGYINLNVITGLENTPLPHAVVTVYVRQGANTDTPVMSVITTLNPILIQLPVAHSPGTIVNSQSDGYSIYDLRIDAAGYYTTRILNIRMYPGVSADFNINMIPISKGTILPNVERLIELPNYNTSNQ